MVPNQRTNRLSKNIFRLALSVKENLGQHWKYQKQVYIFIDKNVSAKYQIYLLNKGKNNGQNKK